MIFLQTTIRTVHLTRHYFIQLAHPPTFRKGENGLITDKKKRLEKLRLANLILRLFQIFFQLEEATIQTTEYKNKNLKGQTPTPLRK